ncbi:MAG TPA: amidohydrolase family protein [Blastocatellia bacterium]|nr:amidohydrolase family protein [Blastocatellia bacterium]
MMYRILFMCAGLLLLGRAAFPVPAIQQPESPGMEARARFDHHVHLLSPDLVRDWKSLGVPFSRPDSFYSSASVVLEERKVEKAFILSMAYLYGSRWFQRLESSAEKEHERVRRENNFIASVVRASPKRLAGFCGVHPMRPYALAELRRCREELGLAGIKLNFLNSGIDLTNSEHLDRLKEIFALAQDQATPILIHLNALDQGMARRAVDTLVNELISKYPKAEVYIAHLGGFGGYSAGIEVIVKAFIAHLGKGGALEGRAIFFELSAVALREASEGVEPPNEERLKQMASDLRKLGLHRVLFGSDHPVFNPQEYARTLRDKLQLNNHEIEQILNNEAPLLKRLR